MTATATAKKTRNASATREAILQAAKKHFMQEGYDQVGIRAIAADAGIDAAMICRYFGSKSNLFEEVLENTGNDPMPVFAGDRETFGRRIAYVMLAPEKHFPDCKGFMNLVTRSSGSEEARASLKKHIEKRFIKPFSVWLNDPKAKEKSWLILSILMGFTITNDIKLLTNTCDDTLAELLQNVVDG